MQFLVGFSVIPKCITLNDHDLLFLFKFWFACHCEIFGALLDARLAASRCLSLPDIPLSPVHTVAEKCDCRTKVRLSQKMATVAEFGDSLTFVRQSHFSATLWTGL